MSHAGTGAGYDGSASYGGKGADKEAPEVTVVIPSLNEAPNLKLLLPKISPDYEVIVVEGGDVNYTREFVGSINPRAKIVSQTRRGKGNALLCGCAVATGKYLVMLDADGSATPDEIESFIAPLRGGADMAKGSRYLNHGGSQDLTRLRSIGNIGFTILTNILFRTHFTDLCYGYNAFTRDMVPRFQLPDTNISGRPQWGDGFEIETLFTCRAALANAKIEEVPSFEYGRVHGISNLNAWRDGKRVLRTILFEWMAHVRNRRVVDFAQHHVPEPEMPLTPPPPEPTQPESAQPVSEDRV